MINASYDRICVAFERKINTTLVFLLSNCPQVLKIFHDLLNIIFKDLGI